MRDLFWRSPQIDGTTLQVAADNGRRAVGIELNPDYCHLAFERCRQLTIFGAIASQLPPKEAISK